jgi:hypothetical protein
MKPLAGGGRHPEDRACACRDGRAQAATGENTKCYQTVSAARKFKVSGIQNMGAKLHGGILVAFA